MRSIDDIEEEAKKSLPEWMMSYYATGTGDEQTLKDNKEAYKRFISSYLYLFRRDFPSIFENGLSLIGN